MLELKGAEDTYYLPPPDQVLPSKSMRYHLFKFDDKVGTENEVPLINGRSFLVVGRDPDLADIVIDIDTEDGGLVSKRHAVFQFRKPSSVEDSSIKLYLLDLGSTNGTFLNGNNVELPKRRYIEMKGHDRLKFGDPESDTEFVIVEEE
ncbi:hypothetical protein FOA43_002846 [Brettanomyces nanus]|uniref:FHA domain-containing protein n=1 Tax=Eeniella nana TaxID=13502 RepID=A0A875S176_EENNA|nr:uncharacterized protein FOA43_002846 [Brettanomyces nanus]QPG75491.1 hypothetical protein FOA43_002846 [Brettanomyces nanus]